MSELRTHLQRLAEFQTLQDEATREEIILVKRWMSTADGKAMLEILERRFGWNAPSFTNGMLLNDPTIYVREGMKMPIAFIHWCKGVDPNTITKTVKKDETTHEGKVSTE